MPTPTRENNKFICAISSGRIPAHFNIVQGLLCKNPIILVPLGGKDRGQTTTLFNSISEIGILILYDQSEKVCGECVLNLILIPSPALPEGKGVHSIPPPWG